MYVLLLGFQVTVEMALEKKEGSEDGTMKTRRMVWPLEIKAGFPGGDLQLLPAMETGVAMWESVADRHNAPLTDAPVRREGRSV